MFHTASVLAALEAHRLDFTGFESRVQASRTDVGAALRRFARRPVDEVLSAIGSTFAPGALPTAEHGPGALPTGEHAGSEDAVLRFGPRWASHRDAREWARERIAGITTLAVDGSQIFPTKDLALPVAAVQAGWFENPHDPTQPYRKNVRLRIVPPAELAADHGDDALAQWRVHARRFELEVETMLERMEAWRGAFSLDRPPVLFLDGALVLTFANSLPNGHMYIDAVLKLLRASEEWRIPVVGYIDTSLARDVTRMLAALEGWDVPEAVYDALVFQDAGMRWGDRSEAFICARDDTLRVYRDPDGRDYTRGICFVYLRTNSTLPPVRLEFPRWVLHAGLLDYVMDVVRCEAIVGTGYPYCIEAADEVAVLGAQDRERFFRLFEDFAAHNGIPLQISAKAASKRRRR